MDANGSSGSTFGSGIIVITVSNVDASTTATLATIRRSGNVVFVEHADPRPRQLADLHRAAEDLERQFADFDRELVQLRAIERQARHRFAPPPLPAARLVEGRPPAAPPPAPPWPATLRAFRRAA